MTSAAIVAYGAVSALGEGAAALGIANVGERARVAVCKDAELERAGLSRPFAGRALVSSEGDRAFALLEHAMAECTRELDRVFPSWHVGRVGLVLGTSSGGMRTAERAFEALDRGGHVVDPEGATYFGPLARAARSLRRRLDPVMLVLGACASGAIAVGLATRWLERGSCDLVLAGGFDEVTVFVAAGFEALRATASAIPSRPFRLGRDGMALGEGAAVLALGPAERHPTAKAFVTGFGVSSDAVHITAPDRTGSGLARAARAAIAEAGTPRIDLVSPHATATPFNDTAEWHALVQALGEERARAVPVHPLKAQIGHTLGAAGALELLASAEAIVRGVVPAAAGEGPVDAACPACLPEASAAGAPRTALKLSAAFGGANAALVVGAASQSSSTPARRAYLGPATHQPDEPDVESLSGMLAMAPGLRPRPGGAPSSASERLARTDGLVRLALGAVGRLERRVGSLEGAGVIVGSALATLETNAQFARRLRAQGPRLVEPRRFPYTSPNVVAGECSVVFGLTGPSFSVGGGFSAGLEALAAATLLVEARDADRVVVVAVDEGGPATKGLLGGSFAGITGAVAVLVTSSPVGARARVGAIELARSNEPPFWGGGVACHEALLSLVSGAPREVAVSLPGNVARVCLEPL